MGINLVGAGAGASQVGHHQQHDLEEMLQQAFRQKQVEQEMELRRQAEERMRAGQQADETYRAGQVERQGRLDDDAATAKRAQSGQREVRSMIGDFLTQRGGARLDAGSRQTVRAMAYREGLDAPDEANEPLAPKPAEGFTLSPGSKRFGADGQEIASVAPTPHAPAQPREERLVQVMRDGVPVWVRESEAVGQQAGSRLPNANGAAPSARLEMVNKALDTLTRMKTHPGKGGAIGAGFQKAIPFMGGPLAGTNAASFQEMLKTLTSQLTLPNLSMLRGLGPASDRDVSMIEKGAGAISDRMKETDFDASIGEIEAALNSLQRQLQVGQPMRSSGDPAQTLAPGGGGAVVKWGKDANGRPVRLR